MLVITLLTAKKTNMMKRSLKYLVTVIVLVIVAYNMVFFKKLDDVKASATKTFDAVGYAKTFIDKKLPAATSKAIDIDALLAQLKTEPGKAFDNYGHALAIGSTRSFLVKGKAKIADITYDDVIVLTAGGNNRVSIATEFVFGNAIRDASNLVKINDFVNTLDLSNVSAEINRIIRTQVLPPFKAKAKKGDIIEFTGAVELNQAHLSLEDMEVIPVSLKIVP
jgi:predicted lipoprotein